MVNDETILAAKASFNGKLEGANITLQGEFRGDLKATGLMRILEGSDVNARVEANAVEIGGRFQGDVHTESLRLLGPARATGTFRAKKLTVEEGGQLDGDFEIGEGPPQRFAQKTPVLQDTPR